MALEFFRRVDEEIKPFPEMGDVLLECRRTFSRRIFVFKGNIPPEDYEARVDALGLELVSGYGDISGDLPVGVVLRHVDGAFLNAYMNRLGNRGMYLSGTAEQIRTLRETLDENEVLYSDMQPGREKDFLPDSKPASRTVAA